MKFKLDENLPAELAEVLSSFGHNADTVLEFKARGSTTSPFRDPLGPSPPQRRYDLVIQAGFMYAGPTNPLKKLLHPGEHG